MTKKKPAPIVRSQYLRNVLCTQTLPVTIRKLRAAILASGLEFNAIAFRGMSGALVVPMLATRLRKGVICCRKPSEQSHGDEFEGFAEGGNYIIVDDFINDGNTVRGIIDVINQAWRRQCAMGKDYSERVGQSWVTEEMKFIPPPYNPVGIFLYLRKPSQIRPSISPFRHQTEVAPITTRSIPVFGCMGEDEK